MRLAALALLALLLAAAPPADADLQGVGSEAAVGVNGTGEACRLRVITDEPARGSQRLHFYCDGWTASSGTLFRYAGARALLVSHWAVASGPTVDLTTAMFGVYAREPALGKAEALRRAQAALRAKPETAHPFFWAPFVLVGDGGTRP